MERHMTVYDLNKGQLDELKAIYYDQIKDENEEGEVAEHITCAEDIPDDVILNHYSETIFKNDDFWCSIGQ